MSAQVFDFRDHLLQAKLSSRKIKRRVRVSASGKGRARLIEKELSSLQDSQVANAQDDTRNADQSQPQQVQQGSLFEEVEAAKRETVLQECAKTTLLLSVGGALLRLSGPFLSKIWPWANETTTDQLLLNPVQAWHLFVVLGMVATVTAARMLLQRSVPEFADASDRSNALVLPNLQLADVLFVSCLPGFSEELFFRGGLIPALGSQWPAVIVVAAIFGFLHQGGGRNATFAAWATFVGGLYGGSYLYTQDLLVPALAHSLANVVSASIWKLKQSSS